MPNQESVFDDVRIGLGGKVLSLVPANSDVKFALGEAYSFFRSTALPDYMFKVHNTTPDFEFGVPIFDPGKNWVLHNVQEKLVICLYNSEAGVYQLATIEPDFQGGNIYYIDEPLRYKHPLPLLGLLIEVLFLILLAHGHGMLFHACGVGNRGLGLIFSGISGAGKSTLARLLQQKSGFTLLSDDRVIVRRQNGRFWAYGTPWQGDAHVASPEAVPLERIFVIHHSTQNSLRQLKPAEAALSLLVRSFPPYWDAAGMTFTLAFLDELVQTVPCYDLGFVPDESVLDFIQCIP